MPEIGFDNVWEYVPNLTARQVTLMILTGIVSLQDGLLTMYPIFALYTPKNFQCANDIRYSIKEFNPNTTNYEYNGLADICNGSCIELEQYSSRSRRNAGGGGGASNQADIDMCYYQTVEYNVPASAGFCESCNHFESYVAEVNKTRESWCTDFHFQDPYINDTIVTEHNLICQYQWLSETIFSLGNVGLAVGSFIGGSITDVLGRKNVMFGVTAVSVASLAIQSFSTNIWSFTVFYTIAKICSQVKYLAYSSYTIEIISPKWRAFAGQMNHIYYALGCILSSILSYFWRDWQSFTYSFVAIHSPLLLFWFFVPESPRWLFLKKRNYEAEGALEKLVGKKKFGEIDRAFFERMEKTDKKELERENLTASHAIMTSTANMTSIGSIYQGMNENPNKNSAVKDIFTFPKMRRAALVVSGTFFVIAMVYMGISYNAAELPGDIWTNNGVNGVLDAAANGLGIVLLAKIGRKQLLFWALTLTGVTYFGSEVVFMFAADEGPSETMLQVSRWLAFTGKFFISGAFSVIYTYTAELFPTDVRTVGLGLGSLGGGVGGIVAPYILTLQKPPISIKWLPSAIFSIFCILCAFFLLLLPETKGQPLYESIRDAERAWNSKETSKDRKSTTTSPDDRVDEVLLTTPN